MRPDGRTPGEFRPIEFVRGFTTVSPGSVLVRAGRTMVLCTASIDEGVPAWREASGAGWLTAEYDMLPGSTGKRRARNRLDGRTREIERLIGRSLRSAIDLARLGPRTITIDCDVLQADGGTRTAAINGAMVALCDALAEGRRRGLWSEEIRPTAVAAISVGVVRGEVCVDLAYSEDVAAQVDCNLVMNERGEWIEVQATAEHGAFSDEQMRRIQESGKAAIERILGLQREARR
ncbi:MAG: ribonuclease PH [Phycisphaerae bacterium]